MNTDILTQLYIWSYIINIIILLHHISIIIIIYVQPYYMNITI